MAPNMPVLSPSRARALILIGFSLMALGVFMSYRLEKHSFERTDDFEFAFLANIFLPTLMLGLAGALSGGVMWAWRASFPNLAAWGISLGIISAIIPALVSPNIHNWTASVISVWLAVLILSCMFITFGIVRYLFSLVRKVK